MLDTFLGTRAELEYRADRDRRSALHQRMGPRFPAGISRAEETADAFPGRAGDGAHRDGHRAGPGRHRQATETARTALLRRQLQPAESDLPRRAESGALRANARVHPQPAERERHRLLREPEKRRVAGGRN